MKSKKSIKLDSLLEKKWNKDRRNFIIFLILTFPTICPFVLVLLAFLRKRREYIGIKGLRDHGKVKALKHIIKKKLVFKDQAIAHIFAIYALVDLDCKGCDLYIYQLFINSYPRIYNADGTRNIVYRHEYQMPVVYKEALKFIAEKRGITYKELINYLKRENKKEKIKQLEDEIDTSDLRIPITKSYILDKEPDNKQSMITKLDLDFKRDEIIACPFCGNMAEKNLMIDWLTREKSCPICKELVSIDECPTVIIKD